MRKLLAGWLLLLVLSFVLVGCVSSVPQPEVKTGEFDFTVTYQINGETKTVSGVYVCEYGGTSWALDGGESREWKGYIKDGTVQEQIEIGTTEDGHVIDLNLALCPEYFMDDFVEGYHQVPKPYLSITVVDDEGMGVVSEPDEVEAYCGAKIISYQYEEPIQNTFGGSR